MPLSLPCALPLLLVARSKRDLEAVRESILSEHQVAIAATVCDIGRPGAAEFIFAEHPEIDILINNAGAVPAGAIDQVDDPTWRVAWDLKVFGYVGLMRGYFPCMTDSGAGVVVNVPIG